MTTVTVVPRRKRLFIDLDGVGADFDKGYYNHFGHWPWEVDDDTMWATIATIPEFFATLPVMDGFLEAVAEFIEAGYEPMFLTACPDHDYQRVADQKYTWVRNHVPHDILMLPVVKGKNKARFVQNPGDILVDDYPKNLLPWQAAGGYAVHHEGDWAVSKAEVHAEMFKMPPLIPQSMVEERIKPVGENLKSNGCGPSRR